MSRIRAEDAICPAGLCLDLFGQSSERGSERARRARLDHNSSSRGRVSPLRCSLRASSARRRNFPGSDASFSFQAVSSSKVSIICEAMASCSSQGSAATLRRASSSSSVMTAVYHCGGEWLRGSDSMPAISQTRPLEHHLQKNPTHFPPVGRHVDYEADFRVFVGIS
jgi:hypothetical protein